jgi:Ca-activated chloride channel family protein
MELMDAVDTWIPLPPRDVDKPFLMPVEIDTKTLSEIAQITNANSYRATNNRELSQIYKDIDKLEKTKMDVKRFSKHYEAYQPFAIVALFLLVAEFLLRFTVLRRIP